MAGGLLNLIAIGNANLFLTGDPSKTFFRATYSKHTNFGLQKFRLDFTGTRDLRLTEASVFTFKIPRYAELLMDTYLVVTLPNIWSPIFPPIKPVFASSADAAKEDAVATNEGRHSYNQWVPYEFRWIEDLGAQMIKEVEIRCGSFVLARYSGEYISAAVERDFTEEKKKGFREMSGNVEELNNPAFAHKRNNLYPNAYYVKSTTGIEPSIRGRNLYIPLNTWFANDSRCSFPLIALQYNELEISVTMRPIQDLFQVRDAYDATPESVANGYAYPYIRPDFNQERFQMYRFLQAPNKTQIYTATDSAGNFPPQEYAVVSNELAKDYGNPDPDAYSSQVNIWNADIHLISTYGFLSKEEGRKFAQEDQMYLVKEVFSYKFHNIYGSKKVKLETNGMVANWMWYFQRNDANMRNEWSNYTNWPYNNFPSNVQTPPDTLVLNPPVNGIRANTGLFITGPFNVENQKAIMESMGILLDGKYRENTLPRGVFDYIEKYAHTNGFAREGIYFYNFGLESNPRVYQPSGAINLGKFKNVELEFVTVIPQVDRIGSSYDIFCNPSGDAAAVNKSNWRLFEYTYDLVIFEERYNILSFIGGNCGMLYAR